MEQNKQKTSQGEAWMDENGILHQVYAPGTELVLEGSPDELRVYRTSFCKEEKRPILVDITNIKTASKVSRFIYSREKMGHVISADAIAWLKDYLPKLMHL